MWSFLCRSGTETKAEAADITGRPAKQYQIFIANSKASKRTAKKNS